MSDAFKKTDRIFILVFNNDRNIVMSLNQSLNFLIGIGDERTRNGWISRKLVHEVVIS